MAADVVVVAGEDTAGRGALGDGPQIVGESLPTGLIETRAAVLWHASGQGDAPGRHRIRDYQHVAADSSQHVENRIDRNQILLEPVGMAEVDPLIGSAEGK